MILKILIIDDNRDLLHVLQMSLEKEGHRVACATSGDEALSMAYAGQPDVVILDVMMPTMDGWEICRRLRDRSAVPILFLSARREEADIVRGLNRGADDYLTKPFSLAELKARVEAIARRAIVSSPSPPIYDDGLLYIDLESQIVRKRGTVVILSRKEFRLLACLVQSPGQVISHADLLRVVWGPGYERGTGHLALYIHYLRQKIEEDPSNPRYIRTRFRVGYYFCANSALLRGGK